MSRKIVCFVFLMTMCLGSVFAQTEKTDKTVIKDNMLFYVHEVVKGQTLYGLSKMYQVSIDDITAHNPAVQQGLKIGDQVYIPASKQKVEIHVVQKGETIYTIARKKGIKENDIFVLNPGMDEKLSIGQEIIVPLVEIQLVEEEVALTIGNTSTENLTRKQKKALKEEEEKQEKISEEKIEITEVEYDSIFHIVDKGETLYSIARKYEITVDELKKANPHISEAISIGQRIYIPISEYISDDELPDEEFLDEDTTPVLNEGIKKAEYTVYLLMPLRLSQVSVIEPSKIKSLNDYKNIKPFAFIQFYEAMLLATEDISRQYPHVKINLYVEDAETSTQIADLIKTGKLEHADMIIGPFQGKEFSTLCQYAKNKNILLVNPFSSTFESYGAMTYKAMTINTYMGESFAKYVLEKYPNANIIFANYQSAQESKQIAAYRAGMQKVFNSAGKNITIQEVNVKTSGISGIRSAMNNMGENFLFTFFEGELTVTNFTQNLYLAKMENLTLVAPEKWLEYDNIETEYFMSLKTHYISQYFVDYSNAKVIRFIDAFRNAYDTEPTLELYAFQGYDFTYYFLSKLCEAGTSFQPFDNNENLISTKFRFTSSVNKNMLENTFAHVFKLKNYKFIDAYAPDIETNTSKGAPKPRR